jgi:hypothetical protein
MLAAEIELGDRPGRRHAEDQVQRHRDRRSQQGQLDRRERVRIDQRVEVGFPALAEGLHKHGDQGQQQEKGEESSGRWRSAPT